jgi:hypothetical protein
MSTIAQTFLVYVESINARELDVLPFSVARCARQMMSNPLCCAISHLRILVLLLSRKPKQNKEIQLEFA